MRGLAQLGGLQDASGLAGEGAPVSLPPPPHSLGSAVSFLQVLLLSSEHGPSLPPSLSGSQLCGKRQAFGSGRRRVWLQQVGV